MALVPHCGTALGHPYSSDVKGSRRTMRELRIKSKGKPIRVFYASDPKRQAVLLLGGHKTDGRFYDELVPRADRILEEYLREQEGADRRRPK